jgi:hypothetical protein
MGLAWGQRAQAETLSGTYLYSGTQTCQIKISAPLGEMVESATLGSAVLTATLGTVAYPEKKPGPAVVAVTTGSAITGVLTGQSVMHVTTLSSGNLTEEIGTATFNTSTGQMTMNRISVSGDAFLVEELGDVNLRRKVFNEGNTFSSTATTLTISGKVHDAVFGDVANGIARHVNLLRLDRRSGCVFRGALVRR